MHTSLGLAFIDGGSTQSFVLGEVADAYPGGKVVDLPEPVAVYGAGVSDEEVVMETALFVATRMLKVELTLQWSVDDAERGSRYGIKPRVQEFGTVLEILVCDDHRVLRDFVPGLEGLRMVIGEDIERAKGWQRVYADFFKAQNGEQAMWTHAQRTSLQVANWCGEISAVQRTILTAKALAAPTFKVGDWVLRFVAERANSLEPMYQGPFAVTADLRNGFYTVCEVLAGDALGKPVDAHVSRLIAFDRRRTTADAEHARKLPEGYYVVEDILDGPNADGLFLVKWMGVAEPRWAEPQELRAVMKFQAYCQQRRLDKSGKPLAPPRARGNRAVGGGVGQ